MTSKSSAYCQSRLLPTRLSSLATERYLSTGRLTAQETDDKGTFHSYGVIEPKIIDYIFVSDGVTPLVYHVIDDKINDMYLSDHYGIYLDLKLDE